MGNINGPQDVDRVFTYHLPTGTQPARYARIRRWARAMGHRLLENCPPSRERSLALTRLQECVQMANASIAINEEPTPSLLTESAIGDDVLAACGFPASESVRHSTTPVSAERVGNLVREIYGLPPIDPKARE